MSGGFTPSSFSLTPDSGAPSPGATTAPGYQAVHNGPAVTRRPPHGPAPPGRPVRCQVPALASRAPADPQPSAGRPAADEPAGRRPGRMASLPAGRADPGHFHGAVISFAPAVPVRTALHRGRSSPGGDVTGGEISRRPALWEQRRAATRGCSDGS